MRVEANNREHDSLDKVEYRELYSLVLGNKIQFMAITILHFG